MIITVELGIGEYGGTDKEFEERSELLQMICEDNGFQVRQISRDSIRDMQDVIARVIRSRGVPCDHTDYLSKKEIYETLTGASQGE